jgi:hypothetical protein
MQELGDMSSILKSGVNDSTHNDFTHSLEIVPTISSIKPIIMPDSGKISNKVSIPNNE